MDITILMTTWLPDGRDGERRLDFLTRALTSWYEHLRYDGNLLLHVADDGTRDDLWSHMMSVINTIWGEERVSWSKQERRGVGASLNLGVNVHRDTLILHAVDDWELFSDLNLNTWAEILEADARICGFRFFPHPDLTGVIKYIPPGVYAIDLDKHHFAFATRPSLWHPRMFEQYGYFEEGASAYEVERLYNEEYCRLTGAKLWLALPDQWQHLGGVELGDITP